MEASDRTAWLPGCRWGLFWDWGVGGLLLSNDCWEFWEFWDGERLFSLKGRRKAVVGLGETWLDWPEEKSSSLDVRFSLELQSGV